MTAQLDPLHDATWTADELASIRDGLEVAITRLRGEIATLSHDLNEATSGSSSAPLHDDLDVASQRAELLQDAVQAENTAAILEQTTHVLQRLDLGLYGSCERCDGPIGRPRLEAFPRATLCMACVR